MQTHPHSHHAGIGPHWYAANVALAVLIALLFLFFLLLFLIMTATPAQAQHAVPPTAAQSAKMPEFAAGSSATGGAPATCFAQRHQETTWQNSAGAVRSQ